MEKMSKGGGGGEEKNTPARMACSFAKPVHQMDGGSDWCGRLQCN